MKTVDEVIRDSLVNGINDFLSQCNEKQRVGFHRIFPKGVGGLSMQHLKNAYDLCRRTIISNKQEMMEARNENS